MGRTPTHRSLLRHATVATIAVFLSLGAAPASAWNSPLHQYHVRVVNNTGGNVNDLRIRVSTRAGGGLWQPPVAVAGFSITPGWGVVPPPVNTTTSTTITFEGPIIPPGAWGWFNVYVRCPNTGTPYESVVWYQWTFNGAPVGDEISYGFCVSSPANIGNPSIRWDGSPNVSNVVVRNLQFANVSSAISNETLTLDNLAAQAAFAASADPVRPGPFVVPPGNCLNIADLHASIGPPVGNGRAVLVKGTVQDQSGNQYDFVSQFEALPPGVPGASPVALVVLAIGIIGLGAIVLARRRQWGGAPEGVD